jgi:putative inorganic carbon (hco3(-)) transporter
MIILIIVFAFLAGAAVLVIPSTYAPIFVLAAMAGVIGAFSFIRKPAWALYFTILVILLPTNLLPAEINSLLNRAATMMTFAVWMLDIVGRRRNVRITGSALFMLAFIAWAAITWLWASHPSDGLEVIQTYLLRFLLFMLVAVNVIKTRKDLDGLMTTLAISGGLVVVVSMWTVVSQGYVPGTRLQVLDVNENALGISLLATFPGILWWAMRSPEKISPLKFAITFIYIMCSILLTGLSGSRGSAISLGITLVAFLFWRSTRPWGVAALLLIGVGLLIAPFVFSTTLERFLGAPGETVLGGRENIWPAALNMIQNHLLLGVGIGNSSFEVVPYLVDLGSYWKYQDQEFLHNPVLVVLSETGLVGLTLYAGILISAVITWIRGYMRLLSSKSRDLLPFYAIIASTFVGYLASWIKGGGMETDFNFYLLLALLIAPTFIKQESEPEQRNVG